MRLRAALFLPFALACNGGSDAPVAAPPSPAQRSLHPLSSHDQREGEPASALPPGHPQVDGPSAGSSVAGTVVIAAELVGRLAPTDTLFIIGRSSATRQILAVKREQGVRFPYSFQDRRRHAGARRHRRNRERRGRRVAEPHGDPGRRPPVSSDPRVRIP
jgi:hypothetical protein